MIGRRGFTLGLAALAAGVAGRAARAQVRGTGPKRDPKDIPYTPIEDIPNHRAFMRDIVQGLSAYARARQSNFILLVRNAPELLITGEREVEWQSSRDLDGSPDHQAAAAGSVVAPYLDAIDGILFDGLFCGRAATDQVTDAAAAKVSLDAWHAAQKAHKRGFAIDYAHDPKLVAAAARRQAEEHLTGIIDGEKDRILGHLPGGRPGSENAEHVLSLANVRNFLPLFDTSAFGSRAEMVTRLGANSYDMLVIDPFCRGEPLTRGDIAALRIKEIGSRRLVLATLPIGHAEPGRFYWKPEWKVGAPPFLAAPDPMRAGRIVVNYWDSEWKTLIGQYLVGLMDLGVDGVLLDDIDAYSYFEDLLPLK